MSQPSDESGTVQVRKFAAAEQTGSYSTMLAIAAAALFIALVLAQVELYVYYDYILAFKMGG